MSRRKLQPRATRPEITSIVIGWDRPLQSFFVQIHEQQPQDLEPVIIVWEGTSYGAIPTPHGAIAIVEPYAEIPPTLATDLDADKTGSAQRHDGPLQQLMRGMRFS